MSAGRIYGVGIGYRVFKGRVGHLGGSRVSRGEDIWEGRVYPQDTLSHGTIKVLGTHPTGMLSCYPTII